DYVTFLSSNANNVIQPQHWVGPGYYLVGNGGDTVAPPRDGVTGFDDLPPGGQTAKNTLVVGAINPVTDDPFGPGDVQIASFSSRGPTDDGRIKPDVVADGVGVYGPGAGGDTSYVTENGTSFSAPGVAGAATLLLDQYYRLLQVPVPAKPDLPSATL